MVAILLIECDCVTEVSDIVKYDEEEMVKHKPVCYFVMNNNCIKERNAFLERPDQDMKSHLKPQLIRSKVGNILMPQFLLRKIGMYDIDLRPYNKVLSNYEGKTF